MRQRTVLIFALCAALVVPCFGSGQGGAAAQGAGHTVSANLNPTGLPIVKQRETYTIAMPRSALSQNNMVEKEPVLKAVRDTNIEINWIEVQNTNWVERMSVMFASGDLPDAIVRANQNMFMQNLAQIADLTDLIDTYTPNLSAFLVKRPDVKALLTAPDGRIYSLPAGEENSWSLTPDGLFINKTWLDALKLAPPATTDEFYTVLKAFKENDLNGNGNRSDEIPFAFCQADGAATLNSMFGSFGILDNAEHLQIMNDVVTFTPTRPEYLEALRYFNKLYSEGLIDSEGFSQANQQYTAKGRVRPPIYGSFIAGVQANIIGIENLPDYIPIPPLKGPAGKQLWNRSRGTGLMTTGLVIMKKCQSPETLVRWYDYLNSSLDSILLWEMGTENLAWTRDPDGRWKNIMDNVPAGSAWGEYRHTLGVGGAGPQCAAIYDTNNTAIRNVEDQNTLNRIASIAVTQPYVTPNVIPVGLEDSAVLQDRAILAADIDTYIKNFVATSIMQGITDAQWATHLQNCERLNVTRYAQSFQPLYDKSR